MSDATKDLDVLALGEAMLEFNQTQPNSPNYVQGFGGDTSNTVLAAARAGARCAYLTRLGNDSFGDQLLALWGNEGVNVSAIERDPLRPTGVYFVSHGPQGHAFTYLRAGSAASAMTPAWLAASGAQDLIARARLLHVSGISMAISPGACDAVYAAIAHARAQGTQVSLDSNLRLALWPLARARACLAQAIARCDYFLPSLDDVTALSGLQDPQAIVDWSHGLGAPVVVLKMGAQGVLLSDAGGCTHLRAHTVTQVDATGAGDCFAGNLLARLVAGDELRSAAAYANAAAALSVQGFGAVAPLPLRNAVLAFMARKG